MFARRFANNFRFCETLGLLIFCTGATTACDASVLDPRPGLYALPNKFVLLWVVILDKLLGLRVKLIPFLYYGIILRQQVILVDHLDLVTSWNVLCFPVAPAADADVNF